MDMVLTLLRQVAVMFALAAVGFALFKTDRITQEGSKTIGNILIYVVLPVVIVNGFCIERTPEHIRDLLLSMAVAAVLLGISMLLSRLFFRRDAIAHFASSFSNPGFFGIPLILGVMGQGAVFYVAGFIAFLNVLQWTYGVSVLTGRPAREGFSFKKLIRAPFFIATLIGLIRFFSGLELPGIVRDTMNTVAGINTPLAMFVIGIYLAQTDVRKMFGKKTLYFVALSRLIIIPLAALFVMKLLPAAFGQMKTALLLAIACPVGSNVAVYAQLHGKNYTYAVETVVISTLFSVITIPLIAYLSGVIWS